MCTCKTCLLSAKLASVKKTLNREQHTTLVPILNELWIRMESAELDAEYWKMLAKGGWPKEDVVATPVVKTITISDEEYRLLLWYCDATVGLSAKTLASVFVDYSWFKLEGVYVPNDTSDMNHCLKLLGLFPEWRGQLDRVVAKYPQWKKIVENWSHYEDLVRAGQFKTF